MGVMEGFARWMVHSKMGAFIETLRYGWNNYSFIFYIGGISAILGGLFGWAGWASTLLTLLFFYYAGKFKKEVDREKERMEKEKNRGRHRFKKRSD